MAQHGGQGKAEAELSAREKRVRKLHIRALAPEEGSRFAEAWKKTQARFVDEPSKAVGEADGLVKELMQARGYPVGDFEQRAADISVDYPNVMTNYRAGRDIALRNNSGKCYFVNRGRTSYILGRWRILAKYLAHQAQNLLARQEKIK